MAISSKNLAAETREYSVETSIDVADVGSGATDQRIFPPPSVDARLVGVRYEVILAFGGNLTLDIKDSAGNACITTITQTGPITLLTRGSGVIVGTDAALDVHGSNNSGNGYHSVQVAFSASGRIRIWLFYRKVHRSGSASKTRLS